MSPINSHALILAIAYSLDDFPKRKDDTDPRERLLTCPVCGTVETEHVIIPTRVGFVNHKVLGTVIEMLDTCETCRGKLFGKLPCNFHGEGDDSVHFLSIWNEDITCPSDTHIIFLTEDASSVVGFKNLEPAVVISPKGNHILWIAYGGTPTHKFHVEITATEAFIVRGMARN